MRMMLTLLSECHFWTIRDEVRIKSTDFGAFRYKRNRELNQQTQDIITIAKRDYIECRNGTAVLKNSRKAAGRRLKDNIKKLEELLRAHKVVYAQWQDATQLLMLFANGIIAHICVDVYTGDILRMVYEKYLVGKLAAEVITDAFFTRSHIVLAYNTNQLTVVHLQKTNTRTQGPEKISNMEPKIFHVIIPGPSERKLSRNLSVNSSFDLFVVWTISSQNEVYPWRPTIRDQDRANIHVFKLKCIQLEPIAYCWTENDPLCVDFLRSSESQILTVEQRVSRKGEITAEIGTYEINSGKMQRTTLATLSMGTHICCHAFSPDQEKLFMGTIDRKICLHDLVKQSTKFVSEIDIIPAHCSWHCDSSLIMIANDRSQFQCFDLALTSIGNQLLSEDVTPSNLLDLSHYFTLQPTLLNVAFSRKPDLTNFTHTHAQTDCFLFVLFENGPIGCLRFFAGAGMRGDIHNSGLTADVVVDKYLALNQLEKAVNLLLALNWETYGAMCLISLHKIANYVFFRGNINRTRLDLMVKALKTFTETLSDETKDEFSDQVFDLKRRFFFFLLRKNLYVEAFEIAQDIADYDLFMDLFNLTKLDANYVEFTAAAFSQAAAILHEEDRANGNLSLVGDYRSESGMSQSTLSDRAQQQQLQQQQQQELNYHKNYVPPLPSLKSKVFNAEMIKINIPKPELRIDTTSQEQRTRPPPPPLPEIRHLKVTPASTMTSTTSTTANVASALATLSLKSGSQLNGNSNTTQWDNPTKDHTDSGNGSGNGINGNKLSTLISNTKNEAMTLTPHTQYNDNNNLLSMTQRATTTPHVITINVQPQLQKIQSQPYMPQLPLYAQPQSQSQTTLQQRQYQSIYQPKFYQHPLVSGTIPPTGAFLPTDENQRRLLLTKKSTASILANSNATLHNGIMTNGNGNGNGTTLLQTNGGLNGNSKENTNNKNTSGERNKVKFSDTVQVAVVPEIPRKEKPIPPKRNGYARPTPRNLTNPKKELADSLPLCHPNDEYLKDFNPISTDDTPRTSTKSNTKDEQTTHKSSTTPPTIKVVHFGIV